MVAEPAGGGGDEHVGEEEGGGEESGLRVVDMEFALDEGLDAGENVAVDKVEEVEGGEEEEREGGGAGWVDRADIGLGKDSRGTDSGQAGGTPVYFTILGEKPAWTTSLLDCHGDRARCVHRARRTGNRHRVGPRGGAGVPQPPPPPPPPPLLPPPPPLHANCRFRTTAAGTISVPRPI